MSTRNGPIVSTILFKDGERFPILQDEQGTPLWNPTLYVTTQLRNASLAPSTTKAALDAIKLLNAWADSERINLEARLARRQVLSEIEIQLLATFLTRRAATSAHNSRPLSLARYVSRVRAAPGAAHSQVDPHTAYNRITAVASYLDWLAKYLLEREAGGVDQAAALAIALMGERLKGKRGRKRKSSIGARMGLDDPQKTLLDEMVGAGNAINPFPPEVQTRNAVILDLLDLGLRAGELLALKVSDFDFQANTFTVARRHGDRSDPRRSQPVVKTRDRILPITDDLAQRVLGYVSNERKGCTASRRHEFLLVTHKLGPHHGQPMSYQALSKAFAKLREAAHGRLDGLSPHVIRHTANDRFSRQMDSQGTPPAQEEKMRSYIMGWREGSGSAATYTRRHTQRKAMEASLRLQKSKRERGPA